MSFMRLQDVVITERGVHLGKRFVAALFLIRRAPTLVFLLLQATVRRL